MNKLISRLELDLAIKDDELIAARKERDSEKSYNKHLQLDNDRVHGLLDDRDIEIGKLKQQLKLKGCH